jgi:hypothetical protein
VSRAKNGPAWQNWWDEMARKTVLRHLCKDIPLPTELARLVNREDEYSQFGMRDVTPEPRPQREDLPVTNAENFTPPPVEDTRPDATPVQVAPARAQESPRSDEPSTDAPIDRGPNEVAPGASEPSGDGVELWDYVGEEHKVSLDNYVTHYKKLANDAARAGQKELDTFISNNGPMVTALNGRGDLADGAIATIIYNLQQAMKKQAEPVYHGV